MRFNQQPYASATRQSGQSDTGHKATPCVMRNERPANVMHWRNGPRTLTPRDDGHRRVEPGELAPKAPVCYRYHDALGWGGESVTPGIGPYPVTPHSGILMLTEPGILGVSWYRVY